MKKFIVISIIILVIAIIFSSNLYAAVTISDMFGQADSWISTGKDHANTTMNTDDLSDISSILYNILLAVATSVAVIVGAILGVMYMTSGIEEKVQVKNSLLPYLISCLVVFGSLGIWKLVVAISSGF